MNRPECVTQEMIDRWEEDRQKWEKENPAISAIYPPEAYYSGCYLGEALESLGCPHERIEAISMATGQRQAHNKDEYWSIVVHAIEEYKQGRWEEPGPELARRIIQERKIDPIEMLAMMAEKAPDKGGLFEKLMRARFYSAYG